MGAVSQVVGGYTTDKLQSIYIFPYMDISKATTFAKHVSGQLGRPVNVNEILLLFDETVFGSALKGVAITEDSLIVSMDMVGSFPLQSISGAEITGLINKKVVVTFKNGQAISFLLTQGNKGAKVLAEVLGRVAAR
jgi:hypothetical protein